MSQASTISESLQITPSPNNLNLVKFSRQVACAMNFISGKGFVHRDLAARNVLVFNAETVKISDFGLTRPLKPANDGAIYYYKARKELKMPTKWMAPECISDRIFTTASDVWSFGILLLEIMSFGETPFPRLDNGETFELLSEVEMHESEKILKALPRPPACPPPFYTIIKSCLQVVPERRKSFEFLVKEIEDVMANLSGEKYTTVLGDDNDYHYSDADDDSIDNAASTALLAISGSE